jgi:hypothetical protein
VGVSTAGAPGVSKGGGKADGGGGGGGGGGLLGGIGGTIVAGDNGAYSGLRGRDLVPGNFTVVSAGNAGYAFSPYPKWDGSVSLEFTRRSGIRVKNAGAWVSSANVYYKNTSLLTTTTPQEQNITGSTTFVVPPGVLKINISYQTTTGLQTKALPVRPGEKLSVVINGPGLESYVQGASGRVTAPAFSTQVFSYIGNVDHQLQLNVQVVTPSGTSISATGFNADQEVIINNSGINFDYIYEGWHGDLTSTIRVSPIKQSIFNDSLRIVVDPTSTGRGQVVIGTQPSAANGYIAGLAIRDFDGGEGSYNAKWNLAQSGYFKFAWDQPLSDSAWVPVKNIYYKAGLEWKPVVGGSNITLTQVATN